MPLYTKLCNDLALVFMLFIIAMVPIIVLEYKKTEIKEGQEI